MALDRLLWVCVGGAAGSGARYLLATFIAETAGAAFPYGTLAVNAIGSFLLGGIMRVGLTTDLLSPTLRLALSTGVMGGFTTYSTFNYETLKLFEEGAWHKALLNVVVTVVACLLAGVLGSAAGGRMVS